MAATSSPASCCGSPARPAKRATARCACSTRFITWSRTRLRPTSPGRRSEPRRPDHRRATSSLTVGMAEKCVFSCGAANLRLFPITACRPARRRRHSRGADHRIAGFPTEAYRADRASAQPAAGPGDPRIRLIARNFRYARVIGYGARVALGVCRSVGWPAFPRFSPSSFASKGLNAVNAARAADTAGKL